MSDRTSTMNQTAETTMRRVGERGNGPRRIKDADTIYEELNVEGVDRDNYDEILETLVSLGDLVKEVDDDEDRTYYRAKEGLTWSDVVKYDCSVKKQLILTLIENPHTFFVLYNTQKGKMKIAAEEIRSWATVGSKKVVTFLVVDNDKTLADQSADGVTGIVDSSGKVFLLSSNSTGTTLESIRTHIDAYAADTDGEYLMPVVVALNNAIQIRKVIALMNHIKSKVETRGSPLRFGVVFDEADKVYPPLRDRFAPLLVDDNRALHRLGFVTATEGDLMEADYPECANAYMYPVPIGDPDYRAIHTEGTCIKHTPHRVKDSNDVYAEAILVNNREYFAQQITLKNGTRGFRKTIVNGGAKTASMETFAKNRIEENRYAITLNMFGLWVHRPGYPKKRYSIKGIRLGELLFNIYVELGLHDKPLFIIGRRKVDRGLGFHHAPRDGSTGLVWTDMILGRVDDKDTAVQKAGRLAGVVAQCPQYPGTLTWWTDEKTARSVSHHNTVVDDANTRRGCSALQAMTRAEATVPNLPTEKGPKFRLSVRTFDSVAQAKSWWKDPLSVESEPHDIRLSITKYTIYDGPDGKCIKYRGGLRKILTEEQARATRADVGAHITDNTPARIMAIADIQSGIASSSRIMPVIVGQDLGREGTGVARVMPVEATAQSIRYIVVYKPDAVFTPRVGKSNASDDSE